MPAARGIPPSRRDAHHTLCSGVIGELSKHEKPFPWRGCNLMGIAATAIEEADWVVLDVSFATIDQFVLDLARDSGRKLLRVKAALLSPF